MTRDVDAAAAAAIAGWDATTAAAVAERMADIRARRADLALGALTGQEALRLLLKIERGCTKFIDRDRDRLPAQGTDLPHEFGWISAEIQIDIEKRFMRRGAA
jgi:hypothetical protein